MFFLNNQQRLAFWQAAIDGQAHVIRAITAENRDPRFGATLDLIRNIDPAVDPSLIEAGYHDLNFPPEPPLTANGAFLKNVLASAISRRQDITPLLEVDGIRALVENSPLYFKALLSIAAKNCQGDSVRRLLAAKRFALDNDLQLLVDAISRNDPNVRNLMAQPATLNQLQNLSDETASLLEAAIIQIASAGNVATITPLFENPQVREKMAENTLELITEASYAHIEDNSWLQLLAATKLGKSTEVKRLNATAKFKTHSPADHQLLLATAARYGQLNALNEFGPFNKAYLYPIMHNAITNNQGKIFDHFIKTQIRDFFVGNNSERIFIDAIVAGNKPVIDKFLTVAPIKQTIVKSNNVQGFLAACVYNNRIDTLTQLIKLPGFGAHLSDNNNKLVCDAIYRGQHTMSDYLLSQTTVNSKPHYSMLYAAVSANNSQAFRKLLIVPAINQYFALHAADNNNQLLKTAMLHGNTEITASLLNLPIVKRQAHTDVLLTALATNQVNIINELLRIPEYANLAGGNNNALLKMALNNGQEEIAARLLDLPAIKANADFGLLNDVFTAGQGRAFRTLLTFPEFQQHAASNNNQLLITAARNNDIPSINLLMTVNQVKAHITANKVFYVTLDIAVLQRLIQSPGFRSALDEQLILDLYARHGAALVSPLLDFPDIQEILQRGNAQLLGNALVSERDFPFFRKILSLYEGNQNKLFEVYSSKYDVPNVVPGNLNEIFSKLNKNQITHNNIPLNAFFSDRLWDQNNVNRYLTSRLDYVTDNIQALKAHPLFVQHAADNRNDLLKEAIRLINRPLVQELLQLDVVKNAATFDLLLYTVAFARILLLPDLLAVPEFSQLAADNNNQLLKAAATDGNLVAVNQLLAIDVVKQNANFETLFGAAQNHHFPVLNRLLEVDEFKALAANNNNQLLRMAVEELQGETVEKLLAIPAVAANANPAGIRAGMAANNVALALQNQPFVGPPLTVTDFKDAVTRNDINRAIELLDIPEILVSLGNDLPYLIRLLRTHNRLVEPILDHYIPNQEFLFTLFERISKGLVVVDDALRLIHQAVFERLDRTHKVHHITLTSVFDDAHWTRHNLISFQANPLQYINLHVPNFPPMKKRALTILDKAKAVQNFIHQEQRDRAEDPESAMGWELENLADSHFYNTIVPAFRNKFREIGGSDDETTCIINIEKRIRNLILDKLVEDAEDDIARNSTPEAVKQQARRVIAFIQNNRLALLPGTDVVLMRQAEALFNSNSHKSHGAWRSYDKDCATRGWKNLLTSESHFYTSNEELPANFRNVPNPSGLEFRRRAAYYYLAAIDNRLDCEMNTRDRQGKFVAEIGEIRRAHNASLLGRDDPSCPQGHKTRMGENMGRGHPITALPPQARELISNILRPFVTEKLNAFIDGKTQEDLKLIYDALTLTHLTAEDVLEGRNYMEFAEGGFTPEHYRILTQLERTFPPLAEIMLMINHELPGMHSRELRANEQVFVESHLTDFSALSNLAFLNIVNARIEHDPPEELAVAGPALAAAAAEPEAPQGPINPYIAELARFAPMLGNPMMRTRAVNAEKKRDIFDVLLPRVEQSLQQLGLVVPPDQINNFKASLTQELVAEFWQTWPNNVADNVVLSLEKLQSAINSFNGSHRESNPNFVGIVDAHQLHQQINNLQPAAAAAAAAARVRPR